jgi:hypothetical protein
MQNLETLRQLSLGDLADDGRRERGERRGREIMPSLMATSLRWRTHSARTKIMPSLMATSLRWRTHSTRTKIQKRTHTVGSTRVLLIG